MDRIGGRRMGKCERMAYGRVKRAQDESSFLGNEAKVQETHQRYLAEVNRQRSAVGLAPLKG
jgi:uncharacterized protein YkwD